MSTPTQWRQQTLLSLGAHGVRLSDARALLALGATLHRLAEAECNGYWPADNGKGDSEECSSCAGYWRKLIKHVCPQCRAESRAYALAAKLGATAETNGDPRSCPIVLTWPDGSTTAITVCQ